MYLWCQIPSGGRYLWYQVPSRRGGRYTQGIGIHHGCNIQCWPLKHIRLANRPYTSYWYTVLLLPTNEVWGKLMFSHLSVSHCVHSGGGVMMLLPVMDSTPPRTAPLPGQHHPLDNITTPEQHHPCETALLLDSTSSILEPPPDSTTPSWTAPPGQLPPRQHHPPSRSTSGRYASYWNAFLFKLC